jgi:hypothetical protein
MRFTVRRRAFLPLDWKACNPLVQFLGGGFAAAFALAPGIAGALVSPAVALWGGLLITLRGLQI